MRAAGSLQLAIVSDSLIACLLKDDILKPVDSCPGFMTRAVSSSLGNLGLTHSVLLLFELCSTVQPPLVW